MPARKAKTVKRRSAHDNYELPAESDFSKLQFIGVGLDALEQHAAKNGTTVVLDSDVARFFWTSESVNTVLRGIIQGLSASQSRKKSA